jgi:hypothetical protein
MRLIGHGVTRHAVASYKLILLGSGPESGSDSELPQARLLSDGSVSRRA